MPGSKVAHHVPVPGESQNDSMRNCLYATMALGECWGTINAVAAGKLPVKYHMTVYDEQVAGLSQDCLPNINKPLTPAEKLHVLSLHNKLRSRVASGEEKTPLGAFPSASNMLQMRWDVELETIADRWASRCFNVTVTKIQDDCRNTKRFRVTQNIGTIGLKGIKTEKQIIQIFYHWYMKSKWFNPLYINEYVADDNRTSEEFLNLIWAETYALGCANVIFRNNLTNGQDDGRAAPWTFQRIVCNYGPGGNIPGKSVYETGIPCSKCPTGWGCSDDYKGLCVNDISKSSTRKTPQRSFSADINEFYSLKGSTFRYLNTSVRTSESHTTEISPYIRSSSSVVNKTETYTIKLRVGIYYNGMCHCPDISRYGFERSERHLPNLTVKLEKFKSLLTRSVGNVISQHETGRVVYGMKNGDRCYCKTSISQADDHFRPSKLLQFLILFNVMKLLIYTLQ